jgi:hypothetical protein
MNGANTPPARNWARTAVFVIGGLQTAVALATLVMFFPQLFAAESLSRAIASAALLIYCGPYLVFAAPALILAARNRYPLAALALCAMAVVSTIVLWRAA